MKTYRNPVRNKITLVQNVDQMLVGSLLLNVLLDGLTSGFKWISGIKHVDHNIRRINDLVKLVPYPLGLTLVENGLLGLGGPAIRLGLKVLLDLLLKVDLSVVSCGSKILETADSHAWLLTLRLGTKRVLKRFRFDDVD